MCFVTEMCKKEVLTDIGLTKFVFLRHQFIDVIQTPHGS